MNPARAEGAGRSRLVVEQGPIQQDGARSVSLQSSDARPGERRRTSPKKPAPSSRWSLYMVRTASGALYTGISNDVERRIEQHEHGRGAKALRGRGPLELVYRVAIGDRAAAQRVEHALKQLSKTEKEAVVVAQPKRRRWASVLRAISAPVR